MSVAPNDFEVMLKFEREKKLYNYSVAQFSKSNQSSISSSLQLELIGLDLEIRLSLGEAVEVESYYLDYPHLGKEILKVYDEVKRQFLKTFCPLTHWYGELPCDFADLEVVGEISRGGMGVVYLCVRKSDSLKCALKVNFCRDQDFGAEGQAIGRVDHPGVCRLVDSGIFDRLNYMVMEWVEGSSLKELIAEKGRFTAIAAAKIVWQLASALEQVHANSVVHFDVHSRNVLVKSGEHPVLIDFGISQTFEKLERELVGSRGTLESIAPELLNFEFGRPGVESDVYSLGVILFECLTGVCPFPFKDGMKLTQLFLYPPCRPSDFEGVNVDAELEQICLDALAKRVENRIGSMTEFRRRLGAWLQTQAQSFLQRFL